MYGVVGAQLTHAANNQLVEIHQYGCCIPKWIEKYGACNYPYFSCDGYNNQYLQKSKCYIDNVFGNVVNCHSHGHHYHLALSTCTHFEGQYHQPRIGDLIFWKGVQGSTGYIHVLVASSCDCIA